MVLCALHPAAAAAAAAAAVGYGEGRRLGTGHGHTGRHSATRRHTSWHTRAHTSHGPCQRSHLDVSSAPLQRCGAGGGRPSTSGSGVGAPRRRVGAPSPLTSIVPGGGSETTERTSESSMGTAESSAEEEEAGRERPEPGTPTPPLNAVQVAAGAAPLLGVALLTGGGAYFKDDITSFLLWFTDYVESLGAAGYALFMVGPLRRPFDVSDAICAMRPGSTVRRALRARRVSELRSVRAIGSAIDCGKIGRSVVSRLISELAHVQRHYMMGCYVAMEVVAVPAVPLTMSAGVIFGTLRGTAMVSVSATLAATLSFLIARYFARDTVGRCRLTASRVERVPGFGA